MYINRGALLNILKFLKKLYFFLNKHFYLVVIVSTINTYRKTKYYRVIAWIVKVFVYANIILGVGYVLYFSISEHSLINGINIYRDLISNYIEMFKDFCIDLINIDIEKNIKTTIHNRTAIKQEIREEIREILKTDVKEAMKDSFKEVIDEALDKINENETSNNNTIKYSVLIGGAIFLSYFIFVLPGTSISPIELNQYNWFNQSLIELKINIINYFNKPTNPGSPGSSGINNFNTTTSIISPVISESSNSIGQSTITPNTPRVFHSIFKTGVDVATQTNTNLVNTVATQTNSNLVNVSTQTVLDGKTVSRSIEAINIFGDVFDQECQELISKGANDAIKNITD